jgi:hypothetical protein
MRSRLTNIANSPISSLDESERLVVWSCRTWVTCVGAALCPICPLEHEFNRRGIADAASALHTVLYETATSATRSFEVPCTRHARISTDEVLLLRSAAAAQRDQFTAALVYLQDWLPPYNAKRSMRVLCVFGTLMMVGELILPLRSELAGFQVRDMPDSNIYALSRSTLH